jgi:hypothetical protein
VTDNRHTTNSHPTPHATGLWAPAGADAQQVAAIGATALLFLAMGATLLSAWLMPHGLSPLRDSLSAAAAQHLPGAWAQRLGFLAAGLAVLWLAAAYQHAWVRAAWWPHAHVGVFLTGAAAFSAGAQRPDLPTDTIEAGLHYFVLSAAAASFVLGTVARWRQRTISHEPGAWLDAAALSIWAAAFAAALLAPDYLGGAQRAAFLTTCAWYLSEATRSFSRAQSGTHK